MSDLKICESCQTWVDVVKGHVCTPKIRAYRAVEDHPVYREMVMKSFFDLAEHAMTMSSEQLEKAWEARVRLCRFAVSKAFPHD